MQIREARLLNHLKHPRIPTIYDIEEDDRFYYIIEEYIEGESLETIMFQSSFVTLKFIYQTIWEISEIFQYLHQLPEPVIYQDLKAEHVIITQNGVKLIDFGIAFHLNETGDKFQNYGTPEFSAPEKREFAKVSVRTDIYSLGKLLEQMILTGNDKSLSLLYIAQKASHPKEEERYSSIEEFQKALKEANRRIQSEQNPVKQKHLLRKIIVAGTQTHIGTTHVAISLSIYLNRCKIPALYVEQNKSNVIREMAEADKRFIRIKGIYHRGDFCGMPFYGAGVRVEQPEDRVQVIDCGADLEFADCEESDFVILVMGSRAWEEKSVRTGYQKLANKEHVILMANYGDKRWAKEYAAKQKRDVYCFPLDKSPLKETREKNLLFENLLRKEGGGYRTFKDKNCFCSRKYSRKWSHAYGDFVGKLRSIRSGRKDGIH